MPECLKILFMVIFVSLSSSINHFSRFDGWYNNAAHPRWGAPGGKMLCITPNSFFDSVHKVYKSYSEFPRSRIISNALRSTKNSDLSSGLHSVLLLFYAQLVVDDIVDTRRVACPTEYLNIEIPNASSDEKIMPVYRAKFDRKTGMSTNSPRKLVNEVTSWLDASSIYGPSQSWSDHLREFKGGRLKSLTNSMEFPAFNLMAIPLINPINNTITDEILMARNPEELLSFGNARGNENVFLMVVEIIWFRYHNILANRFSDENPGWSDQKIFENARKWVIAIYQKITLYDAIPALLGNNSILKYEGYNSKLDPSITIEFSSAAMRIFHNMIPPGVVLRRENCSRVNPLPEKYLMSAGQPALQLCNTYWQLQDAILTRGVEEIILGMVWQTASKPDYVMSDDLRNFLYGPIKRPRMDLLALTIERGRDSGLARYNEVRKSMGLQEITSFDQFAGLSRTVLNEIARAYQNDTSRLELYVGGLLESTGIAPSVGETFSRIIVEQFVRLRDSDRFWFENTDGFFSEEQISQIKNTTFRDILLATTNLKSSTLQPNVFITTGSECLSSPVSSENFSIPCTPNTGKNLFDGYWLKFSGTLILLLIFPSVSYACMLSKAKFNLNSMLKERCRKSRNIRKQSTRIIQSSNIADVKKDYVFSGFEVLGKDKALPVVILVENEYLKILSTSGVLLRKLNLDKFGKAYLMYSETKRRDLMVLRLPKEYDVVVRFNSRVERDYVKSMIEKHLKNRSVKVTLFPMQEKMLLAEAVTLEVRQILLENFFRRVFSEALGINNAKLPKSSTYLMRKKRSNDHIIDCELNEKEFASILAMKPDSLFVKRMFELADTDESGYLSMREFADLLVLLMSGSPEEKAKMLFDMYDTDNSGRVSRDEGKAMIRSFFELASYKSKGAEVDKAIDVIFRQTGNNEDDSLTLDNFTKALLKGNRDAFASANIKLPGLNLSFELKRDALCAEKRSSNERRYIDDSSDKMDSNLRINSVAAKNTEETGWRRYLRIVKRYVENYRRHILCVLIFYAITIAVMIERATHYAIKTEHKGLRQVTEWGLIISRSFAAAISFHYSIILLTMCRNLITFLRETFLNNFVPFDAAVAFHKQIAKVAICETVLHVLGHLSNFYHLSVHPLPIIACIFPNVLNDNGSDLPKSFVWWIFRTITGVTGIFLVAVLSIIYSFAMQYSRKHCFQAFWTTHHLFTLLMILIILHGSVGLVQSPLFHLYLAAPAAIFIIDQLFTISRSKSATSIVKVDPLPSGVTNLVFKRPVGFDYRPGQWVRIACLSLGTSEYHPFTLTSAPHEEHLSLHIRAVGPWTTNLRRAYETAIASRTVYPKIHLDGPFGEGHQDWYKYKVSVLVGAGIGVTPFASILKDIVQKCRTNYLEQTECKKVYFIWVTRTQKHFEWLTDIIRDLEEADSENMVDTHIYITQFQSKFDLRTTVLYICERFFQKEENKSLFTGLQAITHFGRPQFSSFFESLQKLHKNVIQFGVFSCGPPGLTNEVESSCKYANKRGISQFVHFFENF